MMKMTNIKHNGNLLIKDITLPHVIVWYPTGLKIDDHPGTNEGYIDPPYVEKVTTITGETIFQAWFYYICDKEQWTDSFQQGTNYRCYKYKQFYTLDDGDPTWPEPRFRITLQAFGPGYGPNPCGCAPSDHGYPVYHPEWRVDTDMPNSDPLQTGDYARWKQTSGNWIDLAGTYKENRYFTNTGTLPVVTV